MSASGLNTRRYPGKDPGRRTVGWVMVAALHALILWALISGTARKGLELIKKPMEAVVIQEVIIPPPPPPPPPPPKEIVKQVPKTEAPPPPYVPPAEVTPPPSAAPAIQSVQTPPTAPAVIAPPAPPAPPARADATAVCKTVPMTMPRQAAREGTTGVVVAQGIVRGGKIVEVTIVSGPRVFHSTVREAMMQYQCAAPEGQLVVQEVAFKLE